MPMYPAAMSALAPTTVPTRWQPVRITAAVLCFVALVLAVASVFLPLYSGEVSFGGFGGANTSIEMTFTPWSVEVSPSEPGSSGVEVPHVGYPMVFAAVFLAGAACACWYAATPAATRSASRAAGVLTVASGAFLVGTAWTTATLVTSSVEYFVTLGTLGQGLESDGNYLVGYWLLLTAALVGFAAAVLSLVPARQPMPWRPPQQVNPYMATPPYGMGLAPDSQAVVYALPVEPVPGHPPAMRGLTVDPLTGRPLTHGPSSPPNGLTAAVDPLTGQPIAQGPTSAPGGFSAAAAGDLGPVAAPGPFAGRATPPAAQHGPVDPMTGQPLAPGLLTPAPVPFTPEPVGQLNGAQPAPAAAEPPPVVLPAATPLPETPRGPAIPPNEDPLAEPPSTS